MVLNPHDLMKSVEGNTAVTEEARPEEAAEKKNILVEDSITTRSRKRGY